MSIRKKLLKWNNKRQQRLYFKRLQADPGIAKEIATQIGLLQIKPDEIPVFLISHNNHTHVKHFSRQLNKLHIIPIVIDNNSTAHETKSCLRSLQAGGEIKLIQSDFNFGHKVGFLWDIYEALPDVFAYSDPDLQLRADIPPDFLNDLKELGQEFGTYKAGCALPLTNGQNIAESRNFEIKQKAPFFYARDFTVTEWESVFWQRRLVHSLEIYAAPIDTTFAVYNKKNFRGDFFDSIRVAGAYSATHLPWFPQQDPMSAADKSIYTQDNICSSWRNANIK